MTVALTDIRGTPVSGFTISGAAFVLPSFATTDTDGVATLDLTPNSDILQPDTYYTITVNRQTFMILKTADTQTLFEAASLVP